MNICILYQSILNCFFSKIKSSLEFFIPCCFYLLRHQQQQQHVCTNKSERLEQYVSVFPSVKEKNARNSCHEAWRHSKRLHHYHYVLRLKRKRHELEFESFEHNKTWFRFLDAWLTSRFKSHWSLIEVFVQSFNVTTVEIYLEPILLC